MFACTPARVCRIWKSEPAPQACGLQLTRYSPGPELKRWSREKPQKSSGMRFSDDRIPELFCGFSRDHRFNSGPGEYLVSCSPQAWGAGSLFHILQTLAGVQANIFEGWLRIDPLATPLYRRLRVEGMRVGDGSLDFSVEMRKGGQPRVVVDRKPRELKLVELPA